MTGRESDNPAFIGAATETAGTPAGMRVIGRALVTLAEAMVGYFDTLHPGLSRASGGPLA
jgi:hypothetical protein